MAPHCWVPQEQWPLPAPDAAGWLLPDNEPHPLMQLARAPAPHWNQTMPGPTAAPSPEAASASAYGMSGRKANPEREGMDDDVKRTQGRKGYTTFGYFQKVQGPLPPGHKKVNR